MCVCVLFFCAGKTHRRRTTLYLVFFCRFCLCFQILVALFGSDFDIIDGHQTVFDFIVQKWWACVFWMHCVAFVCVCDLEIKKHPFTQNNAHGSSQFIVEFWVVEWTWTYVYIYTSIYGMVWVVELNTSMIDLWQISRGHEIHIYIDTVFFFITILLLFLFCFCFSIRSSADTDTGTTIQTICIFRLSWLLFFFVFLVRFCFLFRAGRQAGDLTVGGRVCVFFFSFRWSSMIVLSFVFSWHRARRASFTWFRYFGISILVLVRFGSFFERVDRVVAAQTCIVVSRGQAGNIYVKMG